MQLNTKPIYLPFCHLQDTNFQITNHQFSFINFQISINMKTIIYLIPLLLCGLWSCSENVSETVTYKINEPVFMSVQDFRSAVKVSNRSEDIENYGKICFYEGYMYISEVDKGIHIIDNRNPSLPKNVGFIELLGNADLAIRNNQLYADSYIDLVWFDVSNPAMPELKGRLNDIFPKALPPLPNEFGYDYAMCYDQNTDNAVVVGWKLKERTEEFESYRGGWFWGNDKMYDSGLVMAAESSSSNGINGSMSRFTLYDNKLYTVSENYMTIFDLKGTSPIKLGESTPVGWNVETIFSYKDNMFLGTPTGMIIYSVTDPAKPVYMSSISHVFGCDPVVVYNDLAYVTIHLGTTCGQNNNELLIIDVSNVKDPKLLLTLNMMNPKGLGIDKGMLFLCDDGLKIYTITTPEEMYLKSLKNIKGMQGYDLIAYENTLMMIAEDGFYQYNYSNINDIKFLSKFSFK